MFPKFFLFFVDGRKSASQRKNENKRKKWVSWQKHTKCVEIRRRMFHGGWKNTTRVRRKETAVNFILISTIYLCCLETFFCSLIAHVFFFCFLKDICFSVECSIYMYEHSYTHAAGQRSRFYFTSMFIRIKKSFCFTFWKNCFILWLG